MDIIEARELLDQLAVLRQILHSLDRMGEEDSPVRQKALRDLEQQKTHLRNIGGAEAILQAMNLLVQPANT